MKMILGLAGGPYLEQPGVTSTHISKAHAGIHRCGREIFFAIWVKIRRTLLSCTDLSTFYTSHRVGFCDTVPALMNLIKLPYFDAPEMDFVAVVLDQDMALG